ncbi:C2 domain-containing protein At1g53590 isoform X2 [Hevea brasiliensis]|uniref:C2 domain-containing protein At1g53590 isoform X2 n=1 Tax=Hevea brasiliensis TaxID=3981 RepID=UPI0025CF6DE9|nr:C2 domain-containing protein At1g53590 isoform X2 [Hevea brasiliensis]
MDITEISIIHHVGIVLFLLWLLSFFNRCHPVAYFISLIYLFAVHERYVMRLRRKLQFHERKQANQKRVLSDSETVRWLNHAVEKIWPICMEHIASQKILLPIIPWFLDKYKPWTAKKAVVQHMYLGRNPPMFTEMRVLRQCSSDDHLALELGMNFCTADDMSAILAVKLRKRLGFGMWAKLHMTAMHVEGKVLIGVKFLRHWPFLGRLRVCFAEPPYFQMTVKPIFTHGLDVTELPGIAGWLDKLLSVAFEQTLVQPNMLVVDVEKFASAEPGLADPYVKGQLGPYKFRTKIQRKTLAPKWHEEFNIPICTWDLPNVLAIEVRDKDHFVDDSLGDCTVSINDLRDSERHDMWLPLQKIKMGRLHLAITVIEENIKGGANFFHGETLSKGEMRDSFVSETANKASFSSSATSDKSSRVLDNFEPINIEGQQETGIWVHQPGSEVSQTWEPRKGKSKRLDNQVDGVPGDSFGRTHSTTSGPLNNESSSADENTEGKSPMNKVRQGLHKISSVFHRGTKNEESLGSNEETVPSPYANIKAVNQKEIGVNFIVEDSLPKPTVVKNAKEVILSPEGSGSESPGKGNVKDKAKSFLKRAEKSARNIKHVLSRKRSRKPRSGVSDVTELEISLESDSSDDESHTSPEVQRIPVVSSSTSSSYGSDHYDKIKENVVEAGSSEFAVDAEDQMKVNVEGLGRIDENEVANSNGGNGNGLEELSKPQQTEKKLDGNGPEGFTNSRLSEEKLEGEMGSDAENIHNTSLG